MVANLDFSLTNNLPEQNVIIVLLAELTNFQNGLIARLEEADAYYSTQLTTKVSNTLDRMQEYSRRLQVLNRNILELTKRVRSTLLRMQALRKGKTDDNMDFLHNTC